MQGPGIERPVGAALGIVIRDGRLLLVRRANPPDAGLWGFPGGKIDAGETIMAAAVREVLEETGITSRARRVIGALDAFDRDTAGAVRRHFILIAVLCEPISGTATAGDDALEAGWFTLPEMGALEMSADVLDVAREAMALVGPGG